MPWGTRYPMEKGIYARGKFTTTIHAVRRIPAAETLKTVSAIGSILAAYLVLTNAAETNIGNPSHLVLGRRLVFRDTIHTVRHTGPHGPSSLAFRWHNIGTPSALSFASLALYSNTLELRRAE